MARICIVMYDCIIAGAGPTGNYTAWKLAKFGFSVLVFEEHEQVGIPVHCTGIVGEKLIKEFEVDSSCIRRRIDSVRTHFPSGDVLEIPSPIKPCILDRVMFDQLLANRARAEGAGFSFNSSVKFIEEKDNYCVVHFEKDGKPESIRAGLCVIATGSMSRLPYDQGISEPDGVYGSAQVDVEMKNVSGIELFIGKDLAPGSFAYAVSTNGKASKVGILSKNDVKKRFDSLIESEHIKDRLINVSSSPRFRRMPFGLPGASVVGRVAAVGDAACQIKTTTGGGIYYGLKCAGILADTVLESRGNGCFNPDVLKKYDQRWKKAIWLELKTGLLLRKLLENVDDAWWEGIKDVLADPRAIDLIGQYRNFDYHYHFLFKFFQIPSARKFLFELVKLNIVSGGAFLSLFKNQEVDEG